MSLPLTIDRFGRVVIPKNLRERYRLHAGAAVEVVPTYSGVEIRPVAEQPLLEVRDGVLVYGGPVDKGDQVRSQRERRLKKLAGQ